MQSFLCRVMTVVFALNCLAPAPGWAQAAAASRENVSAKIQERLGQTVSQQLEDSVAKAAEKLAYAESISEMKQAIVDMHKAMDKKHAAEQQQKRLQEQQKNLEERFVAQRSSTYVAPRANPNAFVKSAKNEVLARLEKDELPLEDLINYIDPFDPSEYKTQNAIYAGEILGNSLDSFIAQPDYETIASLSWFLPSIQLRVMYRLSQLQGKSYSSIDDVMAVGTLRIALWKMHNFYLQTQQPDPIQMEESAASADETYRWERAMKDSPVAFFYSSKTDLASLPPNLYARIMEQFLSELSALKAKKPAEGSLEYQLMMSLAEYAATYAMLTDPAKIKNIVGLFDEGAKRSLKGKVVAGKFQQPYSAILNNIFTTVFEATKYMAADSAQWDQVITMLADFSNPEKYSVPTRIFALEAASLLYGSPSTCQAGNASAPKYPVFVRCNSGSSQTADKYRALFAQRTVDLYAPLTRTHYLSIEDYGLDSKQMQMLADKLAYIYNGFANDDLKMDYSRPRMKNSYALDQGQDGKSLILNDKDSIPRLVPVNRGQQFQLPDGSLKTISGFGRTSDGQWVEMQLKNGLNSKKVSDEYTSQFALFVGNAVFWIYGGEIFALLGTAYRTTKGAMIALPKAVKAAATANKGRRALAFSVEIQKGVRFANLSKTLARNGVTMAAIRTVEKPVSKASRKLPVKTDYAPELVDKTQFITSQHALKGQYSKWNPKRWVGMKPPQITRFSFQQFTPGFGWQAGTAEVAGTSLSKGVHSWDDWRKLRAGFQSLQDPAQHAFPQFFDYAARKALQQEVRLTQAMTQAAKNGAFNLWVPVKTPVYGAATAAESEAVTWWNFTRLGRPGNEVAWEGAHNVLITPTVSSQAARARALDPTKMPNAVELYAEQIQNGSWQQALIKHYFNEVERKGISKYLLPKYVPNANYWKEVGSNWRFGLSAGRAVGGNTRFWQGFKANMIFFTAWAGLDMGTYPFMKSWVAANAAKDQQKEMDKHGDAFDPKKLEADNQAAQAEQKALKEAGVAVNDNTMSTFADVSGNTKETSEGALLVFPILSARYYLMPEGFGKMSFVSEQDAAVLKQMASRIQLNRSLREQNKVRQEKYAKMEEEFKAQQREMMKQQLLEDQQMYEMFFQQFGPAAKNEITALFNDYRNQMMTILDSPQSLEQQYAQITPLQEKFSLKLQQKLEEYMRMSELLQEQKEQEISEEEYIPEF